MDPNRSRAGFSVLELMIALAVLAAGMVAISAGTISAVKISSDSRVKTQAALLAQEQIEIFHVMSAADVEALVDDDDYPDDPGNPIKPDIGNSDGAEFDRRWTIEPDTPETGVITVTVEVDWTDSLNRTRTVSLRTMKAS